MTPTSVSHLKEHLGESVEIRGWLYNRRSSGKIHFLQIRDGTGILQCIAVAKAFDPELFQQMGALPYESAVMVQGTARADDRAPGGVELEVTSLTVVSEAEEYPISKKDHGPDFLLSHRHLWLRSRRQTALMRIRDEVIRAIRDFLCDREFVCVDAPVFTPAACEGTTTLFEVDYFEGSKAYLTQSGQLYLEAGCQAFGRVYCFGPTFRAEKSKTRRHLMEFWMVEPEAAFLDLDGDIRLAEGLICAIVDRVLDRCGSDLDTLERDRGSLEAMRAPFQRISYAEAVDLLRSKGLALEHGEDFGGDEETAISESFEGPVVVHRYPTEIKPFYMKRDPKDPDVVLNMDILAPQGYGEIVGGSVREDDLGRLDRQMSEAGLDPAPMEWYRDLRRYGAVPHAGFGLGIERVVTWLCGLHHLRETIPFPRLLGRLRP